MDAEYPARFVRWLARNRHGDAGAWKCFADAVVQARLMAFPERIAARTHRSVAGRIITFANALTTGGFAWPPRDTAGLRDAIARVVAHLYRRRRDRAAATWRRRPPHCGETTTLSAWLQFFRGALRLDAMPCPDRDGIGLRRSAVIRRMEELEREDPGRFAARPPTDGGFRTNPMLTEDDVRRLLASAVDAEERAFILLLASTALRSEAMTNLCVADVWDATTGEVRTEAVVLEKNSRWRRVELVPAVREALRALLSGSTMRTGRLFRVTTPRLLQRLVRRAGIRGRRNPHQFRTYLVDHALEAGSNIEDIARYLGHRHSHTTLEHYCSAGVPAARPSLDELIEWEAARILELNAANGGTSDTKKSTNNNNNPTHDDGADGTPHRGARALGHG